MKTNVKIHLKAITCLLALLVLIQACSIYKPVSAPYEEATKQNARVRVKYPNQFRLKFNRIDIIDDDLYGVKIVNGRTEKTLINKEKLPKIQVKDKKLSWIVSLGIPVVCIGLLFVTWDELIDVELGLGN
ncbi:hypothetical protein [Tamlana flava]|uniref:hypothetical protein n=1 Tax=Tamlana flava TaxID=3158572 RepID=UPI00351B97FF